MSAEHPLRTSMGIFGTGLLLLGGSAVVGLLICGGGFGKTAFDVLPDLLFAPEPIVLPATEPRLPDIDPPSLPTPPVVNESEPNGRSPAIFEDPARWTEPEAPSTASFEPDVAPPPVASGSPAPAATMEPLSPAALVTTPPVAAAPVTTPAATPATTPPVAAAPVTPPIAAAPAAAPPGPLAMVTVTGDAQAVVVRSTSTGQLHPLPGLVPPGNYEVVVTFPGRAPFTATTLLVLDASPRQVTCRASLGLCKVR